MMKSVLLFSLGLASLPTCLAAEEAPKEIATTEEALSVTILPAKPATLPAPEQMELTKRIHAFIVETAAATQAEAYQVTVPMADDAKIKLLAIPGGEFQLGSADDAQKKVEISPFWMSEKEITWAVYDPFWKNDPGGKRNKDGSRDWDGDRYTPELPDFEKSDLPDAVSQPTHQYLDLFLNGSFAQDSDYPAMDMTNHAAAKFCQWLSAQTGHFYRLPTQAEWEYACRAGTTTTYSFGDDASQLGDYAWFEDNADFTYHKVGQKKPNPWGLYDMHGNVSEWTADFFVPKFTDSIEDGTKNPWFFPTKRYPRVLRGGSFENAADGVTASSRAASAPILKTLDPQVPKSVWYHTGGQHIGFRIVRPATIPSAEEMHLFWNSDYRGGDRDVEDL